jgi:hypothetical protein
MPIAGAVRFRKWAFSAAQSAHGTPATPAAAFPWRGTPTVNPNWTDLDYDTGSIDPVSEPFRTALDTTATTAGPLDYNSLPIVMNGGVRGGVTPTGGGAAKTWTNQALSLTATTLDEFSAQWGDDYNTDSYRLSDGIVEVIDITFPDNLGPAQISTNWYFGTTNQMVTPVANLTVSSNLPLVFGADTALFIDNAYTGIGGTQISDSLHSAHITITNTIDKKRFMNGSNSRFAVAGYTLAGREITWEMTFAKSAAIAGLSSSELRNFLSATGVTRYISMVSTSTEIITGVTPYSWTQNFAGEWRTRADGEMDGNTTITLAGKGRYDSALGYAYKSIAVNSKATLP